MLLRCPCGAFLSRPTSVTGQFRSLKTARVAKRRPDWDAIWKTKIGLELHVQLKGNLKLFSQLTRRSSAARVLHDAPPNTQVSYFDAALPGTLPVLQPKAVTTALKAALALKSEINPASRFDRKHYFYPDLPAGYQITQKYSPLARGGHVRLLLEGRHFNVRIQQIQLEQDTGKSFHDPVSDRTLIDLNRAGAALIEIVTEPDMQFPEEASACLRQMQSLLRYCGASDAEMDKGQLRCDANVSVMHGRFKTGGVRVEIKNLNSASNLETALFAEIDRHIATYSEAETIEQATRGFNPSTKETYHLRSKADAPDYRYMPDPELGPVVITPDTIERVRSQLPETPLAASERLVRSYGIRRRDADKIVALGEKLLDQVDRSTGELCTADIGVRYFERVARVNTVPKYAVNWMLNELLGFLPMYRQTLANIKVAPEELGLLVALMERRLLSAMEGKALLAQAMSGDISLEEALQEGKQALEAEASLPLSESKKVAPAFDATDLCLQVVDEMTEEVEKVRSGQRHVLNSLIGAVMRRSKGKANAVLVRQSLEGMLLPIDASPETLRSDPRRKSK